MRNIGETRKPTQLALQSTAQVRFGATTRAQAVRADNGEMKNKHDYDHKVGEILWAHYIKPRHKAAKVIQAQFRVFMQWPECVFTQDRVKPDSSEVVCVQKSSIECVYLKNMMTLMGGVSVDNMGDIRCAVTSRKLQDLEPDYYRVEGKNVEVLTGDQEVSMILSKGAEYRCDFRGNTIEYRSNRVIFDAMKREDLATLEHFTRHCDEKDLSIFHESLDKSSYKTLTYSCLFGAVQAAKPEMVKMLLENGVDPSKDLGFVRKDVFGNVVYSEPILIRAIYNENLDIVQMLLDQGVDPSKDSGLVEQDEEGNIVSGSCLFQAIVTRNTTNVRLLLANRFDPSKDLGSVKKDGSGNVVYSESSLFRALVNEDLDIVQMLLENGVDPFKDSGLVQQDVEGNVVEYQYQSCLFFAVRRGKHEMVKVLLENGFDPSKDLGFVKKDGSEKVVYSESSLFRAIANEDLDIVQMLLENGVDPSKGLGLVKKNGSEKVVCSESSLFRAIANEDLDIVQMLLENGVDPSKDLGFVKKDGSEKVVCSESSLYRAICKKDANIVRLLLENGVDPSKDSGKVIQALNLCKYSSIGAAIWFNDKTMVELIFNHLTMKNISLKDKSNLFSSVKVNNSEKYLKKTSLLYFAVANNLPDVVIKLLERGVTLDKDLGNIDVQDESSGRVVITSSVFVAIRQRFFKISLLLFAQFQKEGIRLDSYPVRSESLGRDTTNTSCLTMLEKSPHFKVDENQHQVLFVIDRNGQDKNDLLEFQRRHQELRFGDYLKAWVWRGDLLMLILDRWNRM
ncbi:hypothetical protein DID78_06405 [Candidatus Marinamargulisbacteria bacterium SCGC AG-343-D04]|nr:hypothetical protein DID78_06405 [Candidatus Marinamargulisbacteria bacterium SCGC AG-343-D04]